MLPHPVMTTIGIDGVGGADARNQLEPFAAGRRVAAVVQIHQQQIERLRPQLLEDPVGRADELRLVALAGSSQRSASSTSG